jgi:hypothetical protein
MGPKTIKNGLFSGFLRRFWRQNTPLRRGQTKVTTTPCGDKNILQKSYANDIPCCFEAKMFACEGVRGVVPNGGDQQV